MKKVGHDYGKQFGKIFRYVDKRKYDLKIKLIMTT